MRQSRGTHMYITEVFTENKEIRHLTFTLTLSKPRQSLAHGILYLVWVRYCSINNIYANMHQSALQPMHDNHNISQPSPHTWIHALDGSHYQHSIFELNGGASPCYGLQQAYQGFFSSLQLPVVHSNDCALAAVLSDAQKGC